MSTATSQLATVSRPGTKKSFQLPTWAYWIGVILILAVFGLIMTLMFGRVSGEEFSPYDFKRRTFHYYELPVIGAQVWPIKRFDATGDLEAQLVKQKIVTPDKQKQARWDLIRGYRGNTPVLDGDAFILTRYLDLHDEKGTHVWLKWTTDKPKLAKALWPKVAMLAEQELYIFLPDVFETAYAGSDPKQLEADLNTLLANKYHAFARVQQQRKQHHLAVELMTEALKLMPEKDAWKAELDELRKEAAKHPIEEAPAAETKKPA